MRHLFRTDYRQDIGLWRHNGDRFWYGLLALLAVIAPGVLGEFYIGELGAVFIFAIAGMCFSNPSTTIAPDIPPSPTW